MPFDNLSDALRYDRSTGNHKRVKLDRTQETLWQETRSALLISAPMFSHLFYTMLVPPDPVSKDHLAFFTKAVPIAATDGWEIFLNPVEFFKYNLQQRIFVLAHEILHPVFHHNGMMKLCRMTGRVVTSAGKSLPYIHALANQAMDYIINDMLIESRIGEPPPVKICWDRKIAVHTDSWVDVYAKLYKQLEDEEEEEEEGDDEGEGDEPCEEGNGPPKKGRGKGPPEGMGGDVLEPGAGQDPAEPEKQEPRGEGEWQVAVSAAAAAAKAQGKLPAALEQAFGNVVDSKVSWAELIQAFFARKVGSGSYNWDRPDEEFIVRGLGVLEGEAIYAPGRSGFGAGCVVVGMDSSGSIYADPSLIDRWMGELSGILSDVRPKRLVVIWCDAAVQRVDEAEDASDLDVIRHKGAKGGGGTDFRPVFEEIKKMGLEPDALVYLTDGDGDFPSHAPAYPVLWGNITQHYGPANYPFGEVVTIPLQ